MMSTLRTKASREASWGGQQLPPSSPCYFPSDLWYVTLYFCVGTSAAQICWLIGRVRSQAFSHLLPQISLPLWQVSPHGSPGEMLLRRNLFPAQWLSFLGTATHLPPLNNDLVSTLECGIGKRRWPELKLRNKKEQMNWFGDVLLMLFPSISLLFLQALCSYFSVSAASHMDKIQLAKMYACSKEDLPFNL